ncbi:MAG: LPS export ABC transporter periplasmic protein LptC [Flavobacteriales bacterium]
MNHPTNTAKPILNFDPIVVGFRISNFFFFLFSFFFLLSSCGNSIKEVEAINATQKTPQENLTDARLVYTDSGRVKAVLTSVELQHFTTGKKGFLFPKGLQVEFYNIKGICEARVNALFGEYNEEVGELVLQKDVRFINFKQQDTLFTEYLVWIRRTKKISTNRKVAIHGPQGKLWGDGITANENLTKYVWINPVGEYYVNENDTTR